MKCPICQKDLSQAEKVVGKDTYLMHLSVHARQIIDLAFGLLEDIARAGKFDKHTLSRVKSVLKQRQAIKNATKIK